MKVSKLDEIFKESKESLENDIKEAKEELLKEETIKEETSKKKVKKAVKDPSEMTKEEFIEYNKIGAGTAAGGYD